MGGMQQRELERRIHHAHVTIFAHSPNRIHACDDVGRCRIIFVIRVQCGPRGLIRDWFVKVGKRPFLECGMEFLKEKCNWLSIQGKMPKKMSFKNSSMGLMWKETKRRRKRRRTREIKKESRLTKPKSNRLPNNPIFTKFKG